jgi:sodium/hydrogen antiporter
VHSETVFVLTILVLCYATVSGLIRRWYLAPALIFVAIGAIVGRFGIGLVNIGEHTAAFTVLAQLALTVILFNQASMLDLRALLRGRRVPLRLLTIGIPVTAAFGTATAVSLLPLLPFWEAVCLAVIVAPTEVALVDAVVEDRRIPEGVRNALSAESGFYDGFALAALLTALAFASEQTNHALGHWAWFAIRTELVSVGVGAIIGSSEMSVQQWLADICGGGSCR